MENSSASPFFLGCPPTKLYPLLLIASENDKETVAIHENWRKTGQEQLLWKMTERPVMPKI